MSLLFSESFPNVCPVTVAIGAVYSQASSFVLSRPVFGALYQKSKYARSNKAVAKSEENQLAAGALASSALSSVVQSYGVAAILRLVGANTYKAAAIAGTLLLAISNGPQLVTSAFVDKTETDVLIARLVVSVLDTVGLSLVSLWATNYLDHNHQ